MTHSTLDPEACPKRALGDLYRQRWQGDIFHPDYPSSDNLYRERRAA